MESLSGTLHSTKLSNKNGFSNTNAYDGLFSGQKKFGAPIFTKMEDYHEIFGRAASSVPVLDLSGFDDPNESSNFRSSKPDYSEIFGGFPDDDDRDDELFSGVNVVKNSPEKAWATSTRRQPSQDLDDSFDANNKSADALKQYNMPYHKITQKSKDGSNGTTHVTKLHDVPAFTTFINEMKMASSQKADETRKSLAINGKPEVKNSKKAYKQTSGSAVKSKSIYSRGGSFSNDKLFNACDIDIKSHPSKFPSPSFMPPYSENHQARFDGPVKIDVSESDEELDVNSAAATSVAALKKAIEKARESIRIAKESVGRRTEGLESFSKKSFKDSLKVKEREIKEKKVEGKCGRVDAASEVIDLMEKKNACNVDFKDGENLFVARKIMDEINEKILESAWQCERSPWFVPELNGSDGVSVSSEVRDETSGRNQESVENFEASKWSFEQVTAEKDSTAGSAFGPPFSGSNVLESADYHESKYEVRKTNEILEEQGFIKKADAVEKSSEVVEDKERKLNAEVRLNGLESAFCVDEMIENGLPSSKKEEQKVLEKPQGFYKLVNFVKNLGGFVETMEEDKKVSDEVKDDDYRVIVNEVHNSVEDENKMNDSREMIENEQKDRDYEERHNQALEQFEIEEEQEEVLEEKSIENLKSENGLGKDCDHDVNEKISEEASHWVENELKGSGIRNETGMEDSHKEEAIEKWLDEVHELEINDKEPTYVHNMEESEVRLPDDSQKGEETELSEERDANDEKDGEETPEEKCEWVGNDDMVSEDYTYKERESTASGTDGNEENREIEIPHKIDFEDIFGRDFDGFNHDNSVEIDDNNVKIDVKEPTYVHKMEESEVRLQDDSQKGKETELSEERDANDEKDSEETPEEKCEWVGNDDVVTEDYTYKERESTASGTDGNEENREIEIPQKVDYEDIFGRDFDGFNHDNSVEIDDNNVKIDVNNVETGQEANNDSEFKEEKAESVEVSNTVQEYEISEAAGRSSTEDDGREFEVKEVHEAFTSNENEGKYGLGEKEIEVNEIGQTDGQFDFVADSTEAVSNETIEIDEVIKVEVKISFPQEERKLFPKRAHWDLEGSRLPSIPKEKEQTVEIKEAKTEENLYRTTEDKKDKENELKKSEEKKQLKELDEETKRQREEREKERMAVERVIREARERAYAEILEMAERDAVEKATAEVRQRVMAEAREKSEKASAVAKIRAERAAVERARAEAQERALEKAMSLKTNNSGSSRDIRGQSSSADLHGSSGINSESAQRSKAKLESHNRIMERAAKALAEKEKRDLLAQREQAERNRLAETLDAEIKGWSSGKEGNLRALLSTLQYILGSNSGWQPVTLTEIITSNAVKKAYRKATLVVHPDKLQQRGASIQQKYTCEKVFDLLKAAWNKFNSEER